MSDIVRPGAYSIPLIAVIESVCVRVRACMRACVRTYVRACVRACMCIIVLSLCMMHIALDNLFEILIV